jgi:hypothetical protein
VRAAPSVGDETIVRAIDGLTLIVEPAPSGRGSSHRDDVAALRLGFAGRNEREEDRMAASYDARAPARTRTTSPAAAG